ncbi:C40 family peptidase [Streptosporangium sp. CA-135522]|uniref:C40 family peptidase n=1 Tax=Streptosporangium sp. CA-135522 TaxID=3240072 RepID=UPI003D8FE3AC
MITTVLVATALAASLAGIPQASTTRSCPHTADGWRRSLPGADLPDGVRRWFEAEVRAVSAATCEIDRRVSAKLSPPAVPADAEDDPSGAGVAVRQTDVPGSPEAASSDVAASPRAGAVDLSDLPGAASPMRVHQPAVAPLTKPRAARRPSAPSRRQLRPSPGQTAVAVALGQVGRPYVWGGGSSAGPTGGGFDCSGLALHAWSRAGATLTHYTGSQFRQGRRVSFSQLRPGDLVFFGGGTGDPTHVGVYVKDGVMVHAPKTGDVVKTTNFAASAYYRSRYRGAVRPAPRTLAR